MINSLLTFWCHQLIQVWYNSFLCCGGVGTCLIEQRAWSEDDDRKMKNENWKHVSGEWGSSSCCCCILFNLNWDENPDSYDAKCLCEMPINQWREMEKLCFGSTNQKPVSNVMWRIWPIRILNYKNEEYLMKEIFCTIPLQSAEKHKWKYFQQLQYRAVQYLQLYRQVQQISVFLVAPFNLYIKFCEAKLRKLLSWNVAKDKKNYNFKTGSKTSSFRLVTSRSELCAAKSLAQRKD